MANLIIKPTSGGSLVLQDEGGDAAVTVGTTGTTTFAENATFSGTANNLGTVTAGTYNATIGSSASGFAGIKNAQMWWVTTGWTGDEDPMINWEVQDSGSPGAIGSPMTQSGGVFTFPATGIWLIEVWANFRTSSAIASGYNYLKVWTSDNSGSSWGNNAIAYGVIPSQTDVNITPRCHFLYDVTNISTQRVKLSTNMANQSVTVYAHTTIGHTGANFTRIGDT